MVKKKRKKKLARVPKTRASVDRLATALAKRKKAELIDVIVEMARDDRGILRRLESQFGVEAPAEELVAATRQAIVDATDFDEREINYNFNYDYAAYRTVRRNLGSLTELGQLPEAMDLSLELMEQGSYQVEMSDEGMMTDDIEECLQVVIKALKKGTLPAADVMAWCAAMIRKDRVGFICDQSLKALRRQFESS